MISHIRTAPQAAAALLDDEERLALLDLLDNFEVLIAADRFCVRRLVGALRAGEPVDPSKCEYFRKISASRLRLSGWLA